MDTRVKNARLALPVALIMAAAADAGAANSVPGREVQPLRLERCWTLFVDEALDERLAEAVRDKTGRLVLPGGRVLEGRPVAFTDGVVDLNDVLGQRQPAEMRGILINTFTADADGTVQIGAGADWWFDCFVNGSYVYGTASRGNRAFPIRPDNHIFNAPAKKGENLLVLFVESGIASWRVACGPVPFTEKASPLPPDSRISLRRDVYARMLLDEASVAVDPARAELHRRHRERRVLLKEHFAPQAQVLHGPWLMAGPKADAMTVCFVTDGPVAAGVDFRPSGTEEWTRRWNTLGGQARLDTATHRIVLDGLRAGAGYEYRLALLQPGEENIAGTHAEIILPERYGFTALASDARAHRFFVLGDTQFAPRVRLFYLRSFLRDPRARTADFFVHAGDLCSQFDDFIGEAFHGFLDTWLRETGNSAFFVPVRGNHEYWGRESSDWFTYFGRSYGGFRMGPAYYLVLDAGEDSPPAPREARPTGRTFDAEGLLREQRAWLEAAVQTPDFREAAFRVVLAHGSPYGAGSAPMQAALRRLTDDFFRGREPAFRIHLWIAGHIHAYRRTLPGTRADKAMIPINRDHFDGSDYAFTVVTVDGPGKGGLDTSGLLVTAESDRLSVEAMDERGRVFDRFSVDPEGKISELPAPADLGLRIFESDLPD